MAYKEIISAILDGWVDYKALKQVDSEQAVCRTIVEVFPAHLSQKIEDLTHVIIHGSTGAGLITAAPWIATFDNRITKCARRGFYVVYLFSVDLKSLYLCLGLGTDQFNDLFNKKTEKHDGLEHAASRM